MNDKEKEILKKLLKIAETQQKVIQKLAQQHPGISPLDPNAPLGDQGDPLADGLTDPRSKQQVTEDVYKNFPWLKRPGQKPAATPKSSPVAPLPSEIAQALAGNQATAGYKGSLLINVKGKTLDVRYNADYEMDDAQTIKNNIQKALPGYFVTVVGESHSNWAANHQANF